MDLFRTAAMAGAVVAILTMPALAQPSSKAAPGQTHSSWVKSHRVVIQVTQNDPAVMNVALNNAENLVNYYKEKGEKIEIEFVAYGPGLNMMRSDTSPVKERLATIAASMKNITFTGCGNTLANQSKQEKKEISLVPEARVVPTGIARIVELEEEGWAYVRP
jgi:intracellular sulfur oxidation DsrE/DsrF family protein